MSAAPSSISQGGTLVSLGWAASEIQVVEGAIFIPWLSVICFALDLLELAGIIPDPFALLLSLFAGRPREEASLLQAQRLASARNPAARLAGIALQRMVKEWDIVTSEGGPGRAILDAWASQFTGNLVAQGVTLTRAQEILVAATSEAAQTGLPLEPELQTPLAQTLNFNGPQQVATDLMNQYVKQIAAGKDLNTALKLAEQWCWKNSGLTYILHLQVGEFIPPNPPPQTLVPGQNGTCPTGYTLNPQTELCTLNVPPPPPIPIPIGPPGGGQPDQDGDEITNDLCAQMAANTGVLVDAINGIKPGTQGDPDCCANVVNAIGNVATVLASIAAAIAPAPGAPPTPVDLSGVITALDNLVAAVGNLAPTGTVDLTPIVEALNAIAAKIPATSGTDVSGIVDQLKTIAAQGDVDQTIFNALSQLGLLTGSDLQLLQGIKWSDALSYIESLKLTRTIEHWAAEMGADAPGIAKTIASKLGTAGNWAEQILISGLKLERNVIQDVLEVPLKAILSALTPAGATTIGNVGVDPDTVLADTAAVGLNLWVLTALVGLKFPGTAETLEKVIEAIVGILGFEELREVQIGPMVREGIAKVAEQNAKALFGQDIPGVGPIVQWVARGLMAQTDAQTLLSRNGLHPTLQPTMLRAGYRPVSFRAITTMLQDQPFPVDQMRSILEDNAMYPTDVNFMLELLQYNSTKNVRNSYVSELLTAYAKGVVADDELKSTLEGLSWSNDAINLVIQRAALQRRVTLASKVESGVVPLVANGGMTSEQGLQQLEAAGIQDWYANLEITLATTKAEITAVKKAAAAEAKLELARQRNLTRAAIAEFQRGVLDEGGLTAALTALGLDPTLIASVVAVQDATRTGKLKLLYGQLLLPADAKLLMERVAAIEQQYKYLLITEDSAKAQLTTLGVDDHDANALIARWAALIKASTGAPVLLSPITGNPPPTT
jgi:hypothetical protein